MTIIGCNFTKLLVEKKKPLHGKISIKNNIAITNVEETNFMLGKNKEKGLRYMFEFTSVYEPNSAAINIAGEVLELREEKDAAKIIKEWNKSKKLGDLGLHVINIAWTKSNIQALLLSKEIGLPAPIPLTKFQVQAQGKQ